MRDEHIGFAKLSIVVPENIRIFSLNNGDALFDAEQIEMSLSLPNVTFL